MLDIFRLKRREAIHLLILVAISLPLFVWTGHWGTEGNTDALAVAIPAWEFSQTGSLDLSGREAIASNLDAFDRWFVALEDGRIVSNRAPGLIWMTIPSYLMLQSETFSAAQATSVALIATLLAVILLWFSFIRIVPLHFATCSALVLAVGTTTWFVSSSEIWPHGPGQLWAAIAVISLSVGAYSGVGIAMGLSVTTRPLTAIYPAAIGIVEGVRKRRWGPALKVGLISLLGLVAVLSYNRLLFGEWSVRGGYSDAFTSGALERFDISSYLRNLWEMVVGLPNGVLTSTPVVGVAAYGALRHRKNLKPWMVSLVVGSILYLVVHAALNRASGGTPIFYRYPLESIALVSPVLAVGAYRLAVSGRIWSRVVVASAAISVVLQILNVVYFSCFYTTPVVPSCLF